ncbi:MAG TPA: MupA/Atu3671 family FMN-dependent luciferase-like monooxygenase [Myxococcota bacterium]|nr:MupA/Atu3671 family FMN-dependent luciferase-like monooxygenase [Myxococcota bacterium]
MSNPFSQFSCVVAGEESLLIQCGDRLLERGHAIRAVITSAAQIREWADQRKLPVVAPGKGLASRLGDAPFDYFFSITNLALIPRDVLARATRAAINFHDGPLPRYAGLHAPAWAIAAGEPEHGVTFHAMTGGVDEGAIHVQRRFPILPEDTSFTLNARCYEAGIEAFEALIDDLAHGRAQPVAQDLTQRSYFGRHDHPAGAGALDFRRPAAELVRLVRATRFGRHDNTFGSAKLAHRGAICLVTDAELGARDGTAAGAVVRLGADALEIGAGDGVRVSLQGFTCPRGIALTPEQAAARLGLAVGEIVAGPDDEARRQLTELEARASREEREAVRRLERFERIDLPYRRAAGAEASQPPLRVELALPGNRLDGDTLIAAFGAYLSRITGRSEIDLGFSDGALREAASGHDAFASAVVPLRLAFAAEASTSSLAGMLGAARLQSPLMTDLIARYPRLAASRALVDGAHASVVAALADDPQRFALGAETELAFVAAPDGSRASLALSARAFDAAAAESFREPLETFIAGVASARPEQELRRVSLLGSAALAQALREWNDTAEPHHARCVHEWIAEQATRTPDAIAVRHEAASLTYRELLARAEQLASYLSHAGIGPDALVGLYLDRSIEMVVAMLGTLLAGGAYLPLDPAYPAERVDYVACDAGARVVITRERLLPGTSGMSAQIVAIDRDWPAIAAAAPVELRGRATPENLAYVIYTSGSTGKPKGVCVEHRNVSNFFQGMDARIPHDPPGTWLAVTSLSFDISVLELLWTLARGFEVVIYADTQRATAGKAKRSSRPIDFGLAMWGSDVEPEREKYRLMLESARFGDARGFSSFHTPERHFGTFGGLFPNPALTSAALATVTSRIRLRASSCVLPLHSPIRAAEDWAVVDNLSNGRVEVSFATGWQPNDFVIRPSGFGLTSEQRFEQIREFERLWAGEAVEFANPLGKMVATSTLPRPIQKSLPIWITSANNVKTFEEAGARGYNLLTHLLGQTLEEVADKIAAYRRARAAAGFDPAAGKVTLMLHTFVGENDADVRELVREPMKQYLSSAMSLVIGFAWSFPAFKRPGDPSKKPQDIDLASLSPEEIDAILEFAFERYFERSGLFGSLETCQAMVERVKRADVDEICSLIDFGLPTERVLAGLERLDQLRIASNERADEAADFSLPALVSRHRVTHMQCTPSMAKMLAMDPDSRGALREIRHLMIGGEAFPISLARDLDGLVTGTVTNMYGPTETTIWSSTEPVVGSPAQISIGRPITNTQFYVLDAALEPLPVGIAGELCIGGDGVVRGYHARPELTAERFVPDPFRGVPGARLYRTGDLARLRPDGSVEFLGRLDHQVKIRGHRIELGEIEAHLGRVPGVREGVVVAREDVPGDVRLVAYWTSNPPVPVDPVRESLRRALPEFMHPSAFVPLGQMPLTPNGKIDRKALPAPERTRDVPAHEFRPPDGNLERMIAEVWAKVLQVDAIGANDNFFDLGGHSLLVVQAHRELRDTHGQKLTLTDLYRFPTIRGLAAHLAAREAPGAAVVESQSRGDLRRAARRRRAPG